MVSYMIYDESSPWQYTLVAYNNAVVARPLDLQGYTWNLVANKDLAGLDTIEEVSGTYNMAPSETVIMYVQNPNIVLVSEVLNNAILSLEDKEYSKDDKFDTQAYDR